MIGLTPRQASGLGFIKAFIAEHGIAPSLSEIASALGFAGKNSSHRLIKKLEERGRVRVQRSESGYMLARAIEIVEEPISSTVTEVRLAESCEGPQAPQPLQVKALAGPHSPRGDT